MMCLSPSRPFPSTTPPAQRPSSCKLSLFIPATNTSNVDCGFTPAPQKQTSTPIMTSRPKLSLKLGSDTQRPFASFAPLKLDTSRPAPRRLSMESNSEDEEDLTAKNTIANSQIKAEVCNDTIFSPVACYTLAVGTKSILKKRGSLPRVCKAVSFEASPSYIPSAVYEEEASGDEDNMSPPSTTFSTDSESSEDSDNEARTPVESPQTGFMTKRLADKPGFGGGGKWKKAKVEWKWTINPEEDAEELHHPVKVFGEDMVAV